MSDPLVLYKSDSIDARAGAELIRERWQRAELVEGRIHPADRRLVTAGHIWALGYGEDPVDPTPYPTVSVIRPTPDASIAMQVWRSLHCCCGGDGLPPEEWSDDACGTCDQDTRPQPPTWLRYIDDAITERWALPDSREVWAWTEIYGLDKMRRKACAHGMLSDVLAGGRAILRARERWEEGCRSPEGCEFIASLRSERDEVRQKLVEALDHLYNPHVVAEMTREQWLKWWRPACKLAGLDS